MPEMLTNAQYNAVIETIARRLEEQPELTPSKAANIVRESKTDDAKKEKK